jgi:hypothetical protein
MIWGILATIAMIFMPVFESRDAITTTITNLLQNKRPKHHDIAEDMETSTHPAKLETPDPSVKAADKV